MTARKKLNSATVNGVLIVAGLTGLLLQSWPVFLVAAATLVGTAVHSGDIRLKPRGGRKPPR